MSTEPTCHDCGTTSGLGEETTFIETDGTMYEGYVCAPCSDAAEGVQPQTRWIDTGSGPGVEVPVRVAQERHRVQVAYRAWLDHATACDGCQSGQARVCETARPLWAAYLSARANYR